MLYRFLDTRCTISASNRNPCVTWPCVPKPGSGIGIPCIEEHIYVDVRTLILNMHALCPGIRLFEYYVWILNSPQLYKKKKKENLEQTSLNENSVTNFQNFCERYEQKFFGARKCIGFYLSFVNN